MRESNRSGRRKTSHTFPDPDSLVATAAREQRAGCGPGNAFAFGLVSLEYGHTLPFSIRLFTIYTLSLAFPYADVRIKGCGSKRRPRRRPRDRADRFCVSGRYGGMKRESGGRIRRISVESDGLVRGAGC